MGRQGWTHRTDAHTKEIVEVLRAAGYEIHFIDRPVDLLIAVLGVWLPVEVKSSEGKFTEAQHNFFSTTQGPAFVFDSVDQALELVQEIKHKIFFGNLPGLIPLGQESAKKYLRKK